MTEESWTPEPEQSREGERRRLPRTEDMPLAAQGYDRAAVDAAFDAFYRHAAELDATLGVLEAVDAFQKQAADLRADIRALRAASWAPAHARQGLAGTYAPRPAPPRAAVFDVMPRMAVEAAFIILVGVGAALAGLGPTGVILLVLAAWLVVALGESMAALARPSARPRLPSPQPAVAAEPASPEPAPTQIVPPDEIEAVAVEPEPVIEDEADLEPEPVAVTEAPEERPEPIAVADEAAPQPAPKPSFWQRFRGASGEAAPAEAEAPRHVRVLTEGVAVGEVDPWEQGPDLPRAEEAEAGEPATEVGEKLEAAVAGEPGSDEPSEQVALVAAGEPPGPEPVAAKPETAAAVEPPAEEGQPVEKAVPEAPPEESESAVHEPSPPEEAKAEPVTEEPEPAAEEEPPVDEVEAAAEPQAEGEPELPEEEPEPDAEAEPEPEPEAEAEPEPEAEAEPEPEVPEKPAAAEGPPPDDHVEPEGAAGQVEADEETETVEEPVARAVPQEPAAGRWRFWRRPPAPAPAGDEAVEPEPPQHVRVIEVEQTVLPEEVEVPWESEPEGGALGWGMIEEAGGEVPAARSPFGAAEAEDVGPGQHGGAEEQESIPPVRRVKPQRRRGRR